MSDTLPISVVIPTYNGARFLPATLASVRAQTRQPREIIVVDDGSTDESAAVATALGAKVIRQANGGICAARNTGILAATEPYIALLDHDDSWMPSKLERQYAAASHFGGAALIACDCRVVDATGVTIYPSFAGRSWVHFDRLTATAEHEGAVEYAAAASELAQTDWFLMPTGSLVPRDLLVRSGMFDVRLRRWEDTSCFLRLLMFGSLVFINEPLAHWVIHGSNSHGDVEAMISGQIALTEVMRQEPEKYPASYRQRLDREYADTLLELARVQLDRADGVPARRAALASLRSRPSLRALGVLALSVMPPPIRQAAIGSLRRLRRLTPT
jgi:glycosyltransferase involved in cell wall biosynthesis